MPQKTDIEWTDYSSNPLKLKLPDGRNVNACIKVSPGCQGCYAEAMTRRWWRKSDGKFPGYSLPLMKKGEVVLDEKEIHRLLTFKPKPPFKTGDRPRVFVMDMGDIFGSWVPFALVDQLFAVFALRPDVDFQILTKRAERMALYMLGAHNRTQDAAIAAGWITPHDGFCYRAWPWPLHNVWLGVSVERQKEADERIPHLLRTPAAVRFLSCEPLLEHIEFSDVTNRSDAVQQIGKKAMSGIDWCIVGGESGPGARPCGVHWVRSIVRQCAAAGVACFMKQLGANLRMEFSGGECGHRIDLKDPKGGDMEEWVNDLRVREMPTALVHA